MMGNDYFEDVLRKMYQNTGGSYNQLGSSSNQTIEDIIKFLTEQSDKYYEELDQKRKGKHELKFTDEEFNKTCEELGFSVGQVMFDSDSWMSTFNEDYHRPKSTLRKFKLGNIEVRVWNYDNEELQIDEVKFQITPNGELDVHITGQTTLNTLQELSDTVNLYRKSYKVMIETAKQLKSFGDF